VTARRWRATRAAAADLAVRHPRHVVLALAVAGLLLGGRVPASVVAVLALGVAFGALLLPVVRAPGAALAFAAVLLGAAWAGQARTVALDATRLTSSFGQRVEGDATLTTALRADAYGGRRGVVRWRGEPVLVRLPPWLAPRAAPPSVGDVLHLQATLRPPDLAARAVHAHATLRATALTPTGRRRGGPLGVVDGVRRRAEAGLRRHLPPAEAALLQGMVLGDDAALPDELRDAFTTASLSHLTAASGSNIMLLAALAAGLGAITGLGIRARWTLILGLVALYVPLAGGGASIQRAGIMGAATLVAALAGRPASRWYGLLLAATATLLLDPRAASGAGWQLSFAAVLGIALLAAPTRERLVRRVRLPGPAAEAVAVTLAATLSTAPLVALHFDQSSLVALPANVLAAPAVAPIMGLGFAAAALAQLTPAAAAPLVALAGPPLGYLAGLARLAAHAPGAQTALPPAVIVVLCALGAVLLARRPEDDPGAPRRSPRRRAALAVALVAAAALALGPALIPKPALAPPPPGTFRVTGLDIGQGDATLLQAGGHAVLVDAGPPGAGIVARLRAAGVRTLDALVVTHPQADHDGGAPAVLSALPVDLLLDGRGGDRSPTSRAIDAPAHRDHTHVVAAQQGQTLRAGPLTLDVLWPPPGPATPGADPNDRAIVALASAGGATALLTADAESDVLAPLDLPPVDVLKVSHHGSADDGLPALLQRLKPRIALIEVGARNTYGHPTPSTLQALRRAVPAIARTDTQGTVRIDLHDHAATVATG
jgi:competence protein ComEC